MLEGKLASPSMDCVCQVITRLSAESKARCMLKRGAEWSQGRADTWEIHGEAGAQSLSHCICPPLLTFAFQDGGSSYVNRL